MIELPCDFPHKPPKGYSYEVKPFKRNMVAIWLRHHYDYSYSSDVVLLFGDSTTTNRDVLRPVTPPSAEIKRVNTSSLHSNASKLKPIDGSICMKEVKWFAYILLESNRLTKVEFMCPSNLRQDAEQRCKSLYGVTDVRQLTRVW